LRRFKEEFILPAKLKFEIVVEAFKEKGYVLLSDENDYKNCQTKLKYICPKHGEKTISYHSLKKGYGCKECGIDNMKAEDFIKIFIKHKALEMEQEKYANKVLFIDTEAIVTLYYLGLQCGDMDLSMINNLGNSIANLNNYDLYIFLEPDVKWIQDGTRTYGEDETRQKNNLLLKQMLQERGITYEVINGGYHERFEKTKKLINMLI
jgi:nicotinamide riboside kinase